uniref:G-protein coupled receptors family 1 profile domain-containing protein n=1 Tax=Ditylenchus dipsaci TaxID=166011 RepID=A0A915CXS5_9BILA
MSDLNDCFAAELLAKQILPDLGDILQIFYSLGTLLVLIICVYKYKQHKIPIHPNFLLIAANLILLYIYHSVGSIAICIRYQFVIRYYTDPCEILTPVWLNVLLLSTQYIYTQAFVLSHFALTTERIRATIALKTYETQGLCYSIFCLTIVWTLTLLTTAAIIITACFDPAFSKPLIHTTFTTSSNSSYLIALNFILLFIVICTAILDYIIIVKNRNNKKRGSAYDLNKRYQINENVVTMRLILPLDIAFALFFSIYMASTLVLRSARSSLTPGQFYSIFNIASSLLHLHSLVSLLIYLYYTKIIKSRVLMVNPEKQAAIYFVHLRSQWA